MARLNVKSEVREYTHEGARAFAHLKPEQQLRRSVLSCLLWEDEFYEDGTSIADRIAEYATAVKPEVLAAVAIEARTVHNLRHVPLLLLDVLSKTGAGTGLVADTVAAVVQRPDEMGELLSIYWRKGRKMVSHGLQKGLAKTFGKFDEYQLAKYDRDGKVKLRDVLRLARPKPVDDVQSALFKRVKDRALATPDTWEVELSAGKAKKETFERLLTEKKLGYLALLRNLRNMEKAGVDRKLVREAILARKGGAQRVFPFRYVAASRAAPQFEPYLDQALIAAIVEMPVFFGKTAILVDVSVSMDDPLSARSDMTRRDAAATLASIFPGDLRVFAFSDQVTEVPPRRGMAGVAAINAAPRGGTKLFDAIAVVNAQVPHDRLIVITDEQAHAAQGSIRFGIRYEQSTTATTCPDPKGIGYMINVASAQNGVGYGKWTHIDGFSEGVLRYIRAVEDQR